MKAALLPQARYLFSRLLLYAAAIVMALWVLFPLYLIALAAFSPRQAIYQWPKPLLPSNFSTDTMTFFVKSTGVLSSVVNSLAAAMLTVALGLLIGAPAGYAVARFRFRGRDAFQLGVLMTKMFPIAILSVPLAVSFIRMGLYDTVVGVSLVHSAMALPFVVLVTASVFAGVPSEIEEAAMTLG